MKAVAASPLIFLFVALPGAFDTAQAARLDRNQRLRSISDVVQTLEGIMQDSKSSGETEREVYAKFKCQCDDDISSTTTTIEELSTGNAQLENEIEALQGSTGKLSSECAALKEAMAVNEKKRSDLKAVRDNEKAEYDAFKADYDTAIGQMGEAIQILADVNADQTAGNAAADNTKFLGGYSASLLSKKNVTIKKALLKTENLLPSKQQKLVEAFIQAPFTGSYTSQSVEVIGILKNMKETYETKLAEATDAENKAKTAYETLKGTLESEHSTMSDSYDEKQGLLSGNDGSLSSKKTQLNAAEGQLETEEAKLVKFKAECADGEKHYETRKIYRQNEDAALAQAVAILKGEESTFAKVTATSLFQLSARKHRSISLLQKVHEAADEERRRGAEVALRRVAGKGHVATRVLVLLEAGNPFTVVLAKIDEMIKLIDKEAEVDKNQKEWCENERSLNNAAKDEKANAITSLEGQIQILDEKINNEQTGFKKLISVSEQELKDCLKEQKDKTKTRSDLNLEYQESIRTFVTAEETIAKAIKVLKKFYEDYHTTVIDKKIKQTTDKDFGTHASQKSAGTGVISTLETILGNTKTEENNAHDDEKTEQHAYEDDMADLKEQERTTQEKIAEYKLLLAEAEKDLEQAYEDKYNTEKDKMAIENYLKDIKIGCDFAIDKYGAREAARGKEKEALNFAKTKLEGSPAFATAQLADKHEAQGVCKDTCATDEAHVDCKACLAKVSVPGYCAGHPGTKGC